MLTGLIMIKFLYLPFSPSRGTGQTALSTTPSTWHVCCRTLSDFQRLAADCNYDEEGMRRLVEVRGKLIGIDIKTGWFWPLHWNKWNRQIQLLSNIIILTFTIKLEGLLLFSRRRAPGTSQQLQPHRPPPGTSPIEGRSSCDDHEEFGPRERFVQRYALHRGVHCAKLSTSQDQRSDFA